MAKKLYYYGTGRRKSAIARVFLKHKGSGGIVVNGKTVKEYFGRLAGQMIAMQALVAAQMEDQFSANITVRGGGEMAQAGAIRLGIARALVAYDEEFVGEVKATTEEDEEVVTLRKSFRKLGYLTRDPRQVERKKFGYRKARKKEQYSKR